MFNQNSNQWLEYLCYYGPATMGGWVQWSPYFFLQQKERKETVGKNKVFHNRNISKQKYFKTEVFQNISKCHCFNHSRAFRIQKVLLSPYHVDRQKFSVFHDPSTLTSILPALCSVNLFYVLYRTYEQIRGRDGGVSQIARGTNWRYFLNSSQMIDIDWYFQNVEF